MLFALVVIYNKKCEDSLTLKSLKKYNKKINIIVFDNSDKIFDNKTYCKKNNYQYYTKDKNLGLSKAYNLVIKKIKYNMEDYLIVLDDDTNLSEDYLNEVLKKTTQNNYDILLPIVKSNDKIISPANIQFDCRVKSVKEINQINKDKITAINSGMVVKILVYNKILYNENMFLDYVDHDFMKRVRREKFEIHILNSEIIQSFSRDKKNSLDSELFRFKIYKKDFKIYCKLCNNMFYYYINILIYLLKQIIKYKTFKFFWR